MPSGPFGGPRITELLPFSSDEVEVEFEEDRISSPGLFPDELDNLLNVLDETPQSVVKVDRRIIIKQSARQDGIIGSIKNEISELGERASGITYYIINNEIGYISSVFTDRRFRRRGLASKLRQSALDDMQSLGVNTVYTFPASPAGRELAESQGFGESGIQDYLSKEL